MSIIMTALAVASAQAAPAPTPTAQPADHAQHQQMGKKAEAEDCPCCQHMADGKKMACCEKHEKAETGEHAGHSSH